MVSSAQIQGQVLNSSGQSDFSPVQSINLLGVNVSSLNLQSAVNRILEAIDHGDKGYVCVCGAHGLVDSQSDNELRRVYNGAFLATPDGMPLVWALRREGHKTAGRVYGPDLMLELFAQGQSKGLRHYLYGATPETLKKLERGLLKTAPDAKIVGSYSPPFRPLAKTEAQSVAKMINGSAPDIVWVGLGAPKQELWMAEMQGSLNAPVLIGVGAAFDFHAGNMPQAPSWMQNAGLEWLFRLGTEPRRLWRRYFRVVPRYLYLVALQRLGLRNFS
jgi:N-acetylglucosaminyldiphosphoundecaprenol N-acetyl-beta-D-mannosaminyltransferase